MTVLLKDGMKIDRKTSDGKKIDGKKIDGKKILAITATVVTLAVAAAAMAATAEPAASMAATSMPATSMPATPNVSVDAVPRLHNLSRLSTDRATRLAAEALAGLGFPAGAPDGPQPSDRVVVSNTYVVWIDETGFYGKVNGLWWLSPTASGDLSFTKRDTDGRPVNQLIVGENGDGRWPIGMRGAEHIEVPNSTLEPHHDPGCATGWCGAYAHDEAGAYTAPLIPWWRVCDPGTPSYADQFAPVEVSITATSVRLIYSGRLVKTADSAFPYTNTTGCKQDWLFPDGVRRPVYLRVGYEFTADDPWIDRIQQIDNPEGNPPFASPFSVIGGFEITAWPDLRPDKSVLSFVRPETYDVWDQWYDRPLVAHTWNTGFTESLGPRDIVIAWMGQPVTFSGAAAYENATSLRLSHLGPKDNLDIALCVCLYHGTIELGGGLLHSAATSPDPDNAALPVAGGERSIEARRRLETAPATIIPDVEIWTPPTTTPPAAPSPSTTRPSTPTQPVPGPGQAAPVTAVPRFTG